MDNPLKETKINSAFEITKYLFSCEKMWVPRLTCKLSNVINNISNVKSSEGEILQRTDELVIFSRVKQEIAIVSRKL